jgi:hypothetical protein
MGISFWLGSQLLSGRFADFFAAAATRSYVCSTWTPVIADLSFFAHERLELAGLRPSGSAVATSPARLHLSLLRDLQRVVDLDAKVSDGALSELI